MHGHYSIVDVSVRDAASDELAAGHVEVRALRGELRVVSDASLVAYADGIATHAVCYWPPADVTVRVTFPEQIAMKDGGTLTLAFPGGCILRVAT